MQAQASPSASCALDFPSFSQASNGWVLFDSGGGSLIAAQEVQPGHPARRPADPARTGYTFTGWYADPGFSAPWDFETGRIGGVTITLYAKWQTIPYVISYALFGGENNPANPVIYTVEDTVTFYPATHHEYAFAGWYDNAGFDGALVAGITLGSIGPLRLWVKWDKGPATITMRRKAKDRYSDDPKFL
jgi:uncharacterized repeat protein (TIGR02543 family)